MRVIVCLVVVLVAGCVRPLLAPPPPSSAASVGAAAAHVDMAEEAAAELERVVPADHRQAIAVIRRSMQRAAAALADVQDKLKAAAAERDQLRTERDEAKQALASEREYWSRSWLGGRGKAWLNVAVALAAAGIIVRLIALFVLTTFGAVLSRVGSLLLCVSIIGAPLLWAFDELWLAKNQQR